MASLVQAAEIDFSNNSGSTRTTNPIVTGSSVLAVKYKDGVLIMSDTLGSYGSLARFKNLDRIQKVNGYTLVASGGEYSDFQNILRTIEHISIEDYCSEGDNLDPSEIHSYLSRVMYSKRSKANPLWNHVIVAGVKNNQSFLGSVDLYGTTYTSDYVATGFGMHMALPLLRRSFTPDMTFEQAKLLLEDCVRVLYYRDARTINKFKLGMVTAEGAKVSDAYSLETKWDYSKFRNPSD